MSEKSKGSNDTYASTGVTSTRIPQNPLLSASITGLTLDDFPNKPLLLPPAPPIVHLPPKPTASPLGIIGTETTAKKLVTLGKSSNIDSESLDEVNLNTTATTTNTQFSQIDANSNPLPGEPYPDSILSQAASSFSALPSVASTVFSTFSKRLYAGSNSREQTPDIQNSSNQENVNNNNTSSQLQQQQQIPFQQATFYDQPNNSFIETNLGTQNSLQSSLEPPRLYSPAAIFPQPSVQSTPPLAAAGQNTYRLTAKKKHYAPIPGLSGESQTIPLAAPNQFGSPAFVDSYQSPSQPSTLLTQPENTPYSEEQTKGGLFSLSNLAPSGILQNISGLVQSAASTTQQETQIQPINYFASTNPTTLFPEASQAAVESTQNQTYSVPPPVQASNFHSFGAQQGVSNSANYFSSNTSSTAATEPIHFVASVPTSPPTAEFPPTENFLNIVPGGTETLPKTITTAELPPSAPKVPTENFFNTVPGGSATAPATVNFFTPPSANLATSTATPAPIKPPTVTAGPSTFRLQKGTKLYKNPLTAAELAATPKAPAFNLFAPTVTPASNFFVPAAGSEVNFFTPQQQPEVVQKPPEVSQPNLFQTQSVETKNQNQDSVSITQQLPTQQQPSLQQEQILYPPQQQQQPQLEVVQKPAEIPPQNLFQTRSVEAKNQTQGSAFTPQQLPVQQQPGLQQEQPPQFTPFEHQHPFLVSTEQHSFTKDPTEQHVDLFAFNSPIESTVKSEETIRKPENEFDSQIIETKTSTPPATEIDPLEETIKKLVLDPPTNKLSTLETLSATEAIFFPTLEPKTDLPGTTSCTSSTFTPEKPAVLPFEIPTSENIVSTAQQPILPPPAKPVSKADANPFRRNSGVAATLPTKTVAPTLASFFTPVDSDIKGAGDFNIFSAENSSQRQDSNSFFDQPKTTIGEVPPPVGVSPPSTPTLQESSQLSTVGVPPPIGFDNVVSEVLADKSSNANTINFFNQPTSAVNKQQQPINNKQFFDNIVKAPTVQVVQEQQENQRLQNFFNNPPLSESGDVSNELGYALIHGGVGVRNIESSSYSNIVEPPSSACSELTTEIKQNLDLNLKESFETNISREADNSIDSLDTTQNFSDLPEEVLEELKMAYLLTGEKGAAIDPPPANIVYTPAVKHWFYKHPNGANKFLWTPFSHYDSALLETSLNEEKLIAVEGGRYDVDIAARVKMPVYWSGDRVEVRRCSWFYKGADSKYVPYEEATADLLETEYKHAAESGEWHRKVTLNRGEQVVFHGPNVIVHFQQQQNSDAWGGSSQTATRPRVVKRDLDEFTIEQGESAKVDHLLFMVHGIGSACDLRMRPVEEVVEDFRRIASQLVQAHYKNAYDMCQVGRVEVLPISWYGHLHSAEIDEKLKSITLESIPKLRNFTNDTLLDILFYTSPTYCQKIINGVATTLNTVYAKYCERNPEFNGGVSLAGHSLGSLITFDLLCHQECAKETEEQDLKSANGMTSLLSNQDSTVSQFSQEIKSKQVSYTVGPAGTGQPYITYPQLIFHPKKFFALGSPIGMFVTIRGIDKLGLDFRLPTCSGFYNIFHPFDPVAYRIEALVNPEMSGVRPVLIPHHKGRKRMHLELKETMARVSTDLKQRLVDTFKNTLGSVNFLGHSSKQNEREEEESMATEVNKVIEMQSHLEAQQIQLSTGSQLSMRSRTDSTSSNAQSDHEATELDIPLGKLNDSKRIDYVLQEAPLEFFNEYIFALSSHVCYWDSADTILFVMKEIYAGLGVTPDSQIPQHSMTIERPSSRSSFSLPGQSPS